MKQKLFYYLKILIAVILIVFILIGMGSSMINHTLDIYDIIGMVLILAMVVLLLYSAYKHQPKNKLQISPVAIKIMISVIAIMVLGTFVDHENIKETTTNVATTDIDYEVLYKSFIESLKANASKNNLTLYNINYDEDNHIIVAYIDNYNGEEINNDEAYEAIYNYASPYLDLDGDIEIEIQFGNVINNQSKIYTIDNYYKVSHIKNIYGYYFLRKNNEVVFQTDELNTLYDKDVSYNDLVSILNTDIDSIIDSGIEVADFSTIHDYEVEGIYNITQYGVNRSNGSGDSNYNVGDYGNAYDFYLENQDVLSEDEAYEIYYDEYGEYD